MLEIRKATLNDLPTIMEIYNHAIVHTYSLWIDKPVDLDNRITWFNEKESAKFPIFVATLDDAIVGYSTYGLWRPFGGYEHSREHSVYVKDGIYGKGIGTQLLSHLITYAKADNVHVLVAAIEANNFASINVHHKLGFINRGTLPQVGLKYGKWQDLTYMTLQLDQTID